MTMQLIAGRTSSFIALILMTITTLYYLWRASENKEITPLRRIPGLDVIDEAIGRCDEMGRPIHYCTGLATLSRATVSETVASLSILDYVARKCAQLGLDIIVTVCNHEVLPIFEEVVRTAYKVENMEYKTSYVRYVGSGQASLSVAVQGIMDRENPGANFMMGHFDEEAISIAEKGYRTGCIGIGGTATIGQLSILASTMDYLLIGEEFYAASAYLSKDADQTASVAGIDIWKIMALAFIIVGTLLINMGFPILNDLLKL